MKLPRTIAALVLFAVYLRTGAAWADAPDSSKALPSPKPHSWSIETEVIQPFLPEIGIARLRLERGVWGETNGLHGAVVLGAYLRPHIKHDVVEYIDEYMGVVGYRQYMWRGFHAELLLDAGAAWGKNRFDHKEYHTATLFIEANAGYRFGFFEPGGIAGATRSLGFFVTPQVGVLGSLGVADIGPRNGKPDWFLQAGLLVGVSF